MNTVMTIVRTVLPFARPSGTSGTPPRETGTPGNLEEVPRTSLCDGRPTLKAADGTTADGTTADDGARADGATVDLAALIPRQAGPECEGMPRAGWIADECREKQLGERDPGDHDADRNEGGRRDGGSRNGGGGREGRSVAVAGRAEPDDEARDECDVDGGMSTAEYAIGTLAAAALAAVLYVIVTGDSVTSALTSLIEQALSVDF
ncbi:DUF4244 domain-containing protein [Prauserella alba]|uniref:DUF4244 domain-containing protein n=1 Tax=Prauserella alba TaxID=176898 RepID=A0ABP4FXD9_9PSEU|nr:DUF4244 domain-containing protein [Prauserella alba]MCP2181641.1 Protein of unknown function (DUF4244) [Prauserella alba]